MQHTLSIPNGYFRLWQLYLESMHLEVQKQQWFQQKQQELIAILSAPIHGQSSYFEFERLIRETQQTIQHANFIFEMAKQVKPEHFGVLGYMATRSQSIAEALQYILRFNRLVIDGVDISPLSITHTADQFILSWQQHDLDYSLLNEMTMACMVHLAKQVFSNELFTLIRVEFAHTATQAIYHYQRFFNCKIAFKQPRYALIFQVSTLDIPSLWADPSLMQLLLQQAEQAIAEKPTTESLKERCLRWIAQYLQDHCTVPKLEALANAMGLSTRTLQRLLQAEGQSFKTLIDQVRMKRCELLLQQKMSMAQIAEQLGYSDQSALARAYKAHTGHTLLAQKKKLQA